MITLLRHFSTPAPAKSDRLTFRLHVCSLMQF